MRGEPSFAEKDIWHAKQAGAALERNAITKLIHGQILDLYSKRFSTKKEAKKAQAQIESLGRLYDLINDRGEDK